MNIRSLRLDAGGKKYFTEKDDFSDSALIFQFPLLPRPSSFPTENTPAAFWKGPTSQPVQVVQLYNLPAPTDLNLCLSPPTQPLECSPAFVYSNQTRKPGAQLIPSLFSTRHPAHGPAKPTPVTRSTPPALSLLTRENTQTTKRPTERHTTKGPSEAFPNLQK